ncbi:MAG: complex I NDUFA9 subunit family protein [Verrucomicrobiales bacterium]|nr:complex I NDUFA9 subunit family protein [Verrucomicrobiales bacterium]
MVIFLTGGTGFVGRAVTQRFLTDGHQVRRMVRSAMGSKSRPQDSRCSSVALQEIPIIPGDSHALRSALAGVDVIVHLVGIIAEWGEQTFERVHLQLTRDLLAAAQAAGVQRWIHMSALGTRADARSRYHQTKWLAEHCVRSSSPAWTIFRPSIIYGSEDQFTHFFARISQWSPAVPIIGSGQNLLQPVAVEQVARAFAGAVARPESAGQHYDLAGPERLSLEAIVRHILRAQGRRRLLVHLPLTLARWQAAGLETFWPMLAKGPPPLTRDQILMLQEDNVGDPAPADRDFGLVHESFAKGIAHFLGRT